MGCTATINLTTLQAYRTFAETTAAAANISFVIDTNFGLTADPRLVATAHIRGLGTAGLWPWVRGVEIGNGQHTNLDRVPTLSNQPLLYARSPT